MSFATAPIRAFSLDEIKSATHNFADASIIGNGGFGKVYRGIIDNGTTMVAVKRLSPMSKQGAPEFSTELSMLSNFRHSNLVSLIGYCRSDGEMTLIYEYMIHGALADHLHGNNSGNSSSSSLPWVQRLKICIGAAHGLNYLHTGTGLEHKVIHRDVKSSNILLNENWAAKISDFGLSKIGQANQSSINVNTNIGGTPGYVDPDYVRTRILRSKSDVYSFGVVLFEVLCGKPALHQIMMEVKRGPRRITEAAVYDIMDPSLRSQILSGSWEPFVQIADKCLDKDPKKRPTMTQVVASLESVLELQLRGPMHSSLLALNAFNNAFASSSTVPTEVIHAELLESEFSTISITRDNSSYAEVSDSDCGNEVHNGGEQKKKEGVTLDKRSGKKCYMLKAKELSIEWIDSPENWTWRYVPESSFVCENSTCSKDVARWEVAELLKVYWLELNGKFRTSELSPKTAYVGYLVFKIAKGSCGLDVQAKTHVKFAGKRKVTETIYFKSTSTVPNQPRVRLPRQRVDGWMEIEVGEFFNDEGDDRQVKFKVMETDDNNKKRGLIILGIHLRPKENEGFTLDKWSGKKCYMLKARELSIEWIDSPENWTWRYVPESSFVCENSMCSKDVARWEVAELLKVYWLELNGKFRTSELSPKTAYVGYLVFKIAKGSCGLDVPAKTYVKFAGKREVTETIYFKSTSSVPSQPRVRFPRQRVDGWMEIEVGEFFNDEGDDGQVKFKVTETDDNNKKRGLIILGIHLRPKENV